MRFKPREPTFLPFSYSDIQIKISFTEIGNARRQADLETRNAESVSCDIKGKISSTSKDGARL
jgi:hypothetical protein